MFKINKVLASIAVVSALCGHSSAVDGDFRQMLKGITTSAKLSNGVEFHFEMPLKVEILKSIGGNGVDVLIVGDGSEDSVIRHYYKPKFSNKAFSSVYRDKGMSVDDTHCAYEDRVVPPSSEEAKMLRKYFWFKRMAINFLIFEEKFGAEINEIAGDDYRKLKKDFSKAAKRFNPKKRN